MFYQLFKCFMILIIFEFFAHTLSMLLAKFLMVFFKWGISDKFDMSRFLIDMIISWMNCPSSSLSLIIDLFLKLTFFLTIGIVIVRGVWLEVRCYLEWIEWLSSLNELHQRNIRSMTEFELFALSEYLVGTWLVGIDRFKLNESVIIRRLSLMDE